jgi:uncharacterized protein (DUF427 family)
LRREYFRSSNHHTACSWKGASSCVDVKVGGEVSANAAGYYPEPKEAASRIGNRVPFWKAIDVVGA